MTKCHRPGGLNNRHSFLTVLGGVWEVRDEGTKTDWGGHSASAADATSSLWFHRMAERWELPPLKRSQFHVEAVSTGVIHT